MGDLAEQPSQPPRSRLCKFGAAVADSLDDDDRAWLSARFDEGATQVFVARSMTAAGVAMTSQAVGHHINASCRCGPDVPFWGSNNPGGR